MGPDPGPYKVTHFCYFSKLHPKLVFHAQHNCIRLNGKFAFSWEFI